MSKLCARHTACNCVANAAATKPEPTAEELRYRVIVGCDAVHPDRRGGQHVAMTCSGVLVIDQQAGLGVMVADERSMIKNKERALRLLKLIEEHGFA